MPRYRVVPYRQGSRAARSLADALAGRVLRLQGGTFVPRRDDVVINYGSTELPRNVAAWPVLNPPQAIRNASNKLTFFRRMADTANQDIIPRFWTRQGDIPDDAFPIVCRTVLAGHSGEGIVIADDRRGLVNAPLYVEYIKKQQEYRIHLGLQRGQPVTIAQQRKARDRDVPDGNVNWQVRNHQNGFIFVRGDVAPPACVLEVSRRAFLASGLDFGAIDVIYNERERRAYVLEINTAPGLEGQTIEDYANFFRNI